MDLTPLSKPRKSVFEGVLFIWSLKWVTVLKFKLYDNSMSFTSGMLLVMIFTNPPEKSAGISAEGDLTIIILSI